MFHRLVSHNDDLRRLVEKGYAVAFEPGYLIVRDIPYVDDQKQLKIGAIVAKLEAVDGDRMRQDDHQIFFAGTAPCNIDGAPIRNLGGGPTPLPLSEASTDVVVQRSFSNKPSSGAFTDFFDKIESYVTIISGPAIELHGANPFTFRTVETMPDSVFKFHDTLTSRAEITDLSAKCADDVVAVIGLGGTGAYILDFLVKTHVREIRGFDFDWFHMHNAFRSPGRLEAGELGKSKAEVYQARYDNFRKGLKIQCQAITSSSEQDLDGVTFAFVCVDKGSARSAIIDLLIRIHIPFIDVGMGLNRKRGPLNGMVRVTYFSAEHAEQVRKMGLVETSDAPDEEYRKNIQLSELNALNAGLAMIKFKQLRGFYGEEHPDYQRLMDIGRCSVVGEWQLE